MGFRRAARGEDNLGSACTHSDEIGGTSVGEHAEEEPAKSIVEKLVQTVIAKLVVKRTCEEVVEAPLRQPAKPTELIMIEPLPVAASVCYARPIEEEGAVKGQATAEDPSVLLVLPERCGGGFYVCGALEPVNEEAERAEYACVMPLLTGPQVHRSLLLYLRTILAVLLDLLASFSCVVLDVIFMKA
jgi:hypothetical protein